MARSQFQTGQQWKLPPLILHPFADASGPDKLAESTRASLVLQGVLPNDELTQEELNRRVLDGRFQEVRMLCYVGKDVSRWMEQCMEAVARDHALSGAGIHAESFAALLVEDPPGNVKQKLQSWGVADHRTIFSRALGLAAVFADPPPRETLSESFIRYHYRYADHLYRSRQQLMRFTSIRSENFGFDLYASGEYARMLEKEWERE